MGNVLQTIRLSVLHKRITALVEVMPKTMVAWKTQNDFASTLARSKGGMTRSLSHVMEDKLEVGKIRVPLNELDLGSDDIASSGDLRGISLCTDVDIDEHLPVPQKEVDAGEEILVVDWDYMSSVPVCTWEALTEEQLWDDYTRQHSPIAGTIPIEEFCKIGKKESSMISVTESADGDTVILFERCTKNRESSADQFEKEAPIEDGNGDRKQAKKNQRPKWNIFALLPSLLFKRFKIKDPISSANRSIMKGGLVT